MNYTEAEKKFIKSRRRNKNKVRPFKKMDIKSADGLHKRFQTGCNTGEGTCRILSEFWRIYSGKILLVSRLQPLSRDTGLFQTEFNSYFNRSIQNIFELNGVEW